MGRPSLYTEEIADEICERLAQGESLNAICKDDHMPSEAAVRGWAVHNVNEFSAKYAHARDMGLDVMADKVLQTAFTGSGDVPRDRLSFDAVRWYLSKLAPKRYGDRLQHEHAGEDGGPLEITVIRKVIGA